MTLTPNSTQTPLDHSELPVHSIVAETLTADAFAPFGTVLTHEGVDPLPIRLYDGVKTYRPAPLDVDSDEPLEWLIVEGALREFRIHYLERHFKLAQAFIPMGGQPAVLAVASPDCRLEQGVPAPEEVRAFLIPGNAAVQIHRGTWHEPPFALVEGSTMLITSHQALTAGLGQELNEDGGINVMDVDKRNITESSRAVYRIQLP